MQQIWRQVSVTLAGAGRLFNRLNLKSIDSQAFMLAMAENDPDALHNIDLLRQYGPRAEAEARR
jgi:hypothetical protein